MPCRRVTKGHGLGVDPAVLDLQLDSTLDVFSYLNNSMNPWHQPWGGLKCWGVRLLLLSIRTNYKTCLTEVSQYSAKTNTDGAEQENPNADAAHRSAGWHHHKEAEDPCKWTGRGQQGTLAAARAAHTLGCLSRIAANTLAEMIIPIWVAARHVSSLVSPSTEIAQLERANGKEAAAHHARPEAVRKVKAGSHIILHYTGEQRLQEKSASNSLQRCKGKGQQRKLQLSHLF